MSENITIDEDENYSSSQSVESPNLPSKVNSSSQCFLVAILDNNIIFSLNIGGEFIVKVLNQLANYNKIELLDNKYDPIGVDYYLVKHLDVAKALLTVSPNILQNEIEDIFSQVEDLPHSAVFNIIAMR